MREVGDAPHVGVHRPVADHVDEADGAVRLHEAREPDERVDADEDLDEVERQQRDQVDDEALRVDVVPDELASLVDDEPLLEVPGPHLHADVGEVHEVGDRVQREPRRLVALTDLGERLARDARPQVVEHADRDAEQPVEEQVALRFDDEQPLAAAGIGGLAGRAPVVAVLVEPQGAAPVAGGEPLQERVLAREGRGLAALRAL